MRTTKAISVTLTHRQHEMVKAKVASGEYASELLGPPLVAGGR